MRQALHAEWTKLRSLPGVGGLVLALITVTVAVSATVAAAVTCPWGRCTQDAVKLSLTGVQVGQAFAAMLAVLAICGEYSTGMMRTTLTAMPRRATVLGAKSVVLTGLTLVAGTVAVLGSVLAGRLILPARGYPPLSLADAPTLRAAVGS